MCGHASPSPLPVLGLLIHCKTAESWNASGSQQVLFLGQASNRVAFTCGVTSAWPRALLRLKAEADLRAAAIFRRGPGIFCAEINSKTVRPYR